MSIPLAWESYSFPQPLGESVRAVLIYNEWKSERTEDVEGGGLGRPRGGASPYKTFLSISLYSQLPL